ACLVAQARIGQRFQLEDRVQVFRFGDPLEQLYWRKPAGNDPPARPPLDADNRWRHPQPPRWASRYCRTTNRSATWPDSILSSAELPENRGASFGRLTHSSAALSSGSRICSAL